MTFNDDANLGKSKVQRRGRTTGMAAGGGGIGIIIVLFIISQVTGVDVTSLLGGGGGTGSDQPRASSPSCETGADANANVSCLLDGAYVTLDDYWITEAKTLGISYHSPELVDFQSQTSTGCGTASTSSGPFYCPPDETIYIDTAFYDELRSQFGASGGPLAELYVVAHEWGHHIQQLSGTFDAADRSGTGPTSDSVRLELQADCFAGAWAGSATETTDANGVPYLEPITNAQLKDALNAAAAVGDDHIQQATSGQVQPESFTHGTSAQRQRWFAAGYNDGATSCDTFAVSGSKL
jgi:uncharacterized protein